jgi:hypothetical protein
MFGKLIEITTGRDDLERVAKKGDMRTLSKYLETRRVWVPRRPRRFLDAANFTQDELMELIEEEAKELAGEQVELWVLEVDGKKRLPAFSSQKKMQTFSGKMSKQLNKVFSLGCLEVLLFDIAKNMDIDFVDLNLLCDQSWEIGIGKQR